MPSPHIVVSHGDLTAGSRVAVTCTITVDSALTSNDVQVYGHWSAQNHECVPQCDIPTNPEDAHVFQFNKALILLNGIYVRNVTLLFDGLYIAHGDIYTCHASVREDNGRSKKSSGAIEITVQGTVDHYRLNVMISNDL